MVIAREAIRLAANVGHVQVMADDTDILILLLYHATDYIEITMKIKGSQININSLRNAIGAEMIECLPFAHAVSG